MGSPRRAPRQANAAAFRPRRADAPLAAPTDNLAGASEAEPGCGASLPLLLTEHRPPRDPRDFLRGKLELDPGRVPPDPHGPLLKATGSSMRSFASPRLVD